MAKEVIKKSGKRELFDPDKIKDAIWEAAQRTDLSDERKDQIVNEVSEKIIERFQNVDVVSTSEIRDAILEELDDIAPEVADSWREYEAEK